MIRGSGSWNRAAWGEPINQADLFFQVVGFSKLMIDSLQRMGYRFTAEEKEGYYLFWRHVAALLGVEKALLPSVNETDCGRFWDLWMLTNPGPDEDGIALGRTTLEALAGLGDPWPITRRLNFSILCGTTRWLLGWNQSEALKVPRTVIGEMVPFVYSRQSGYRSLSRGDCESQRGGAHHPQAGDIMPPSALCRKVPSGERS